MKYLSVEKRCDLIVDAYHTIFKVLEKPLLKKTSTTSRESSRTTHYGVLFRTRESSYKDTDSSTNYEYDYKGKKSTFEDAIDPYIDKLSDFKAGKKGTLIIFGNEDLLENIKSYGKAELYELVPNVTVVEYDFEGVVNSTSCYIDCCFDGGELRLDGQAVLSKGLFDMKDNISKEFLVDLFYLFSAMNSFLNSRRIIQIEDWKSAAEEISRKCPQIRVALCGLDLGGTYEYKDVNGCYQWVEKLFGSHSEFMEMYGGK